MTAYVKLPPKLVRQIQDLIEGYGGTEALHKALDSALAASKPRRSVKAARARKAAKRAERNAEWARIREGVLVRADGCCEACFFEAEALEVDHFFGGSGRRYEMQAEETCWALCPECHRDKTHNRPSAENWLKSFIGHCERYNGRAYARAAVAAQARLAALEIASQLPHGRTAGGAE